MKVFEYAGKRYVRLNGKDFLAIRLYCENISNPIFGIFTGKTALRKEDLPDQNYVVHRICAKEGDKVWAFWKTDLHKIDSTAEKGNLFFTGADNTGSWFMALNYLVKRHGLGGEVSDDQIWEKAKAITCDDGENEAPYLGYGAYDTKEDKGSSGVISILLHYDPSNCKCRKSYIRDLFGLTEKGVE